jgi:hypothetical protein
MHLSLQSAISLTHFTSISLILYSTNPHCIYPSSPLFVLPTLHLSLFSSILPTHYASFPLILYSSNPLCCTASYMLFAATGFVHAFRRHGLRTCFSPPGASYMLFAAKGFVHAFRRHGLHTCFSPQLLIVVVRLALRVFHVCPSLSLLLYSTWSSSCLICHPP